MRFLFAVLILAFFIGAARGQYILTQPQAYSFFEDFSADPLAFEDINNNGYLDMTLGGNFTDFGPFPRVAVNFNSGGGNFGNWQTVSYGTGDALVKEMEYGFLRGTSERDLVATFTDHTEVLWNVNNTLTVQQTNLPAGTILSLGKVNNDANDDLALVTGSLVEIYLNTGSGTFNTTSIQTLSEQPAFIRLVDLDNNGSFFDLVTRVGSTVKVRKNSSGTFGSPTNINNTGFAVEIGDVNNDGYPDLLAITSGSLKIYLNDGNGNIHTSPDYQVNGSEFNSSINRIALGDMNNDGWNDLVAAYYEGKLNIWINSGSAPLFQGNPQQPIAAFVPYTSVYNLDLADVENTGGLSAAISMTVETTFGEKDGRVYLFKHDGNPAPAPPKNLTVTSSQNNHPELFWDANAEADLDRYNIYKNRNDGWGWQFLASTSAISYEDEWEIVHAGEGGKSRIINYKITAVDLEDNESDYSNTVQIAVELGNEHKIGSTPGAEETSILPRVLELGQNHPNPFNPVTAIRFALPEPGPVELTVYSLTGQKVITLAAGFMDAGYHTVEWNGRDASGNTAASGIYIYQFKAGTQRFAKKMLLAK